MIEYFSRHILIRHATLTKVTILKEIQTLLVDQFLFQRVQKKRHDLGKYCF